MCLLEDAAAGGPGGRRRRSPVRAGRRRSRARSRVRAGRRRICSRTYSSMCHHGVRAGRRHRVPASRRREPACRPPPP